MTWKTIINIKSEIYYPVLVIFYFSSISERMGSTFSICNDTKSDIWVWNGACFAAIIYPITGVLTVASIGAGGVAFAAGGAAASANAAAGSAVATGFALTSEAGVAAALAVASAATASAAIASVVETTAIITGFVLTATTATIATTLGITESEAAEFKKVIKNFTDNCDICLKPGQTYTYSASLSLVRSVWLMNVNGEQVKRDCWTGATANSDIRSIS